MPDAQCPEQGWEDHEREQVRAWLRLTPLERLRWLEQAKEFAARARAATRECEEAATHGRRMD
ncbi:MAG: hypothetical protein AMXMBFR64_45000 [Myxococcales bacterium]